MPPRFPTRYRDGFVPDAVGPADYLRGSDGGDWQKKRLPEAVVAREGLFVNVTREVGVTRMYLTAFMAAGGARVFGSAEGTAWRDGGASPAGPGWGDNGAPFMGGFFKGVTTGSWFVFGGGDYGYLPGGVITSNGLDKFGLRWWFGIRIRWAVVPSGKVPAVAIVQMIDPAPTTPPSFQSMFYDFSMGEIRLNTTPRPSYPTDDPKCAQNPVTDRPASSFAATGVWDNDGTPAWYAGLTTIELDSALQYAKHVYIVLGKDTTETTLRGSSVVLADAAPLDSEVHTLAPGRLLKVDTFYYPQKHFPPEYVPGDDLLPFDPEVEWKDAPRKPLAIVQHSIDAGRTWAQVSAPIMDSDIGNAFALLDDYRYFLLSRNYKDDTEAATLLTTYSGVSPVKVWIAPLSRALSVVLAAVPVATDAKHYGWRLKLGTVGATGVMQGSTVVDDGAGAFVGRDLVKQAIGIGGEVLFVMRDRTNPYTTAAKVYSTSNGSAFALRGTLPAPEEQCGMVSAISPKQLLLPVVQGGVAKMFRSRDAGATWEERRVIGEGVRSTSGRFLDHLTSIAIAEREGKASYPYPATPWLTDCRISHE